MFDNIAYQKEWQRRHPNYFKQPKYLKKHNQTTKKYSQTEKGKQTRRKVSIKCQTKRHRNMNWIPMFENPFDEKVDWHHINDVYVIAIPEDLHELYYGKYHREMTMEIVKQIYLESF